MCGIIGFQGSFSLDALSRGLSAIAHRGPDDAGVFYDERIGCGLGHARLSIIDLSALGHQPMPGRDGGVQLVFNGEIYNFRELRSRLEARGHRFRGHSDTEVLLHLYLEHGVDMLPMLNGIFAFALLDSSTESVVVARDAMGVKPLYLSQSPRGVAFCSEIKGLVHLSPEVRRLDPAAVNRYLTFQWCPGSGTAMRGVEKLLPGEAMILSRGRVARRWMWHRPAVLDKVVLPVPADQAIDGAAEHLRQAVDRQLVSDVPVGAFLSGGLDSSAVVAFARERNPDIRCFTIEAAGGQDEGEADDLPYARRVAAHLGVPLEVVRIDPATIAADLGRMVWQLDEPLGDPAPLNVLYICQQARSGGVKVLLSGAGGDDIFSGYRRHRAVAAEGAWTWLPRSVRAAVERVTGGLDQRHPGSRRIAKLFRGAALEGDDRIVSYFQWYASGGLAALYTPEFSAEALREPAAAPMLEFLRGMTPDSSRLQRMLALEQRFFLADHNLIYTDKMSMAAGVEVRVPFLDPDLVEFAARIPDRLRQRGATGKWVLKRAMEPYLPRDVIYRPKTGFTAPIRRWIRHELRPMVHDLLASESVRRRGMFRPDAVQRLIADNEAGRVDAGHTLLTILCLELWCRSFIDHVGERP